MTRTDWKPSRHDRAILAGYDADASPRYELAAAVRVLNARLADLPPERQAELLPIWNASWDELERARETAQDDGDELTAIRAWLEVWAARLQHNGRN